jgi:hypothetical protein
MNWLRVVLVYTLGLTAVGIGAGIVLGVVYRILGVEQQWGIIDVTKLVEAILTLAITFGVFMALAKKHPTHYISAGAAVAVLSAILSTILAYFTAPPGARAGAFWLVAVAVPLFFNAAALFAAGLYSRRSPSSSNTSLERTREG